MPFAQHHPFERGQPLNAHGAARVEFVGADADFSAQAVFKAVGKARAGIDHAAGRVHFAQKALGVRVATGAKKSATPTECSTQKRNI